MNTTISELLARRDDRWRFSSSVQDTFTALYTIAQYDKTILEGEPLAIIVQQLFTIESKPGGPYYSIFPDDASQSKTFAKVFSIETNTAIARFLGLYDIELPTLTTFLGKTFLAGERASKKRMTTLEEKKTLTMIRVAIKNRLKGLPKDLQVRALAVIERTISGNPDKQMSLMAYYTTLALGQKKSTQSQKHIVDMGVANIFFWTAFIIYDDFWDEDEAQDTRLLPIANLFARTYTEYFTSLLPEKSGLKTFFHTLMDNLDAANVWETTYCRAKIEDGVFIAPTKLPVYGDYINKYRAASGHIVGPVALLCMQGHKISSAEVTKLITYFEHYLIAMQLNDDMHDWEEDLERGHISTAILQLLKDYKKKELHLIRDRDELRELFWFTTLPKLAKKALSHVEQSRTSLYSMKSIKNFAPLEQYIIYPEHAVKEAIESQKQSVEFIKNFI